MGYCMHIQASDFTIRSAEVPGALKALCDSFDRMEQIATLEEALGEFDWEVCREVNGDITDILFEGYKYSEEREHALAVIAPFVESGSYIEMMGEDGAQWRWFFDCGQLLDQHAIISWDKPGRVILPTVRQRKLFTTES